MVSGDKIEAEGFIRKVYDGQEIKFCCKDCIKDFENDQAKYLKEMTDD
ncbi:MAG: hypothetical protein HY859_09670 [Caulobacterales bacterium]|nr:hypothetical protein [Caulobacterales bacterium]